MSKEEEQQKAQATMRIDITPSMLDELQQAPFASPRRAPAHPAPSPAVIRIVAPAQKTLGGADFQALLSSVYDAVFLTDLSGHILSTNPRAEQFFNATKAEICKRNVLDWLCGATEDLLSTIQTTLGNNRFILIQALCQRTDSSMFPAEISVCRIKLAERTVLGFFLRDITWRKEAEERIKTGYNALQNAASGIAVADVDGNLSGYINPSMATLLGLPAGDAAPAQPFASFLASPDAAAAMAAALQAGDTWSGPVDMKRLDGTPFYAQASLSPNLNPDGVTTGIVVSLVDTTTEHLAQQQLEHYATQLRNRNREMAADLQMARDLQYAFLPAAYPAITTSPAAPAQGSLRFAHIYSPAALVGGDFFSVLPISSSSVIVFIADVMGHGARASLVVATIRGLLESIVKTTTSPGPFLQRLNATYSSIFASANELMFASAACLRIDLDEGLIHFANAGHPLPLCSAPDGDIATANCPNSAHGSAIGLFPDATYDECTIPFRPGQRILFYTDGITEAQNAAHEEFGEDRLLASIHDALAQPLPDMLSAALSAATGFSGSDTFEDDVCLLGIEFAPPAAGDPAAEASSTPAP